MSLPSLYQQFIHVSRYARWRDQDNRRETWEETVDRYLDFMCDTQCPGKIDDKTRAELRTAILALEVMPSMRCLMTAGPALARDNAAGFNPVAGDTPVLTREYGMIPISELSGKTATVLNVNSEWTPATFKSYGVQPLYEVLVRRHSKQYVRVRCTANHRWVLTDGTVRSTVQLARRDKLSYASAKRAPNLGSLDYNLGVAHGIIYGDGTRQYAQERDKGYLIRICGDYDDILACFAKLPEAVVTYPPSFNGDPIVQLYGTFGHTHLLKELPAATETDDYLIGFVRGWLAADGTVDTYGGASLCLDDAGLAWLLRIGPKFGYIVQYQRELPEQTNFGKRKQRTFTVTLDRSALTPDDFIIARKRERFRPLTSEFTVVTWKALNTSEAVYCAQVPVTNTFTLDQGLVTGNCTGLIIDSVEAFDEMMYLLMCGCGVGFSVERQFIDKLPAVAAKLRKSPSVIKVDDSRMGWANAVRELISLLYQGRIPEWDVSEVRPAGAQLKTFGGRASGPGPLVDLFRFIINIFRGAEGRKLTSIECHDIACKIGEVVVAGGVRRSAEISLSNLSDDRMRDAKSGQWWETTPWRAMANNSAVYTEKPGMRIWFKEWQALYDSKSGERGIFNREAVKKHMVKLGRRNPEYDFIVNPCAEIVLRPSQMCNLSEVVVRSDDDINSLKRKIRLATILGTMQATLTNFHYLRDIWKQNAEEEALLGVSLTGVMDNKLLSGQEGKSKLNDALEQLKAYAIETNKTWAKKLGINQATAVTTIKPSGTVSQLVDCASGMHPRWSQYYIRTVRGSINDPVAKMMMERGFPWEPSVMKPDVEVVFSFPVKAPDNCITVDRISAIEQLELWKAYKEHWCEHQPSITVYVREHEWMEVGAWVYKHFDIVGGLSFLPATDHTYQQAPYQEVPKAEYDALLKQMPELQDWSQLSAYEKDDSAVTATREIACSGGSCEIVDVIGK